MEWFRLLVLWLSIISSAGVSAQIYQWKDENGQVRFSDRPPPSTVSDGETLANERLEEDLKITVQPIVLDLTGMYPEVQNGSPSVVLSLRNLLNGNRFIEINQALASYYSAMESDIAKEEQLATAYSKAFNVPEWAHEQIYRAWANATPNNYQPYLARAYYYYSRAWDVRGNNWSSETPQEDLDEMKKLLVKARYDLDTALRQKSNLLPAYALRILIANTLGEDSAEREALEEGLDFYPDSFWLRSNYLRSITPKWGGSYEEMLSFVSEAEGFVSSNPKLGILPGYVIAEAADSAASAKAYTKAVELYSEALRFGEGHYFLAGRGKNYYRKGEYELAIADLDKAILQYNEDADYYYWRSRAYYKQEKYKRSLVDAESAADLKPLDSTIRSQLSRLKTVMAEKGIDSNVGRNLEQELAALNSAVETDRNNSANFYDRARFFVDRRKFDLAIEDIKAAIDLNPDNIAYYNLLDWCLLTERDFDQIISYWDRYLYRHPENGSAYFERSGTYYLKGDLESAESDLRKAAELGNPEAKRQLER